MIHERECGPQRQVQSAIAAPTDAAASGSPINGSWSDFCAYRRMLDRTLSAGRITDKTRLVGLATYELTLQEYRTPTRAEIAAKVSRTSPCSIGTVENAHNRLRRLGVLAWDAQYIMVVRWGGEGRQLVPQRSANVYRFSLPADLVPPPLCRTSPKIQRKRRLHSRDRLKTPLPFLDPKSSGVNFGDNESSLTSSLALNSLRHQILMERYEAEKAARHAKMVARSRPA